MDSSQENHLLVIVQARMGSTRLPNKVLKEVSGMPLLGYLLERLQQIKVPHTLVVATTNNLLDDEIVEFCNDRKVAVERGSEEDVLDRFFEVAEMYEAPLIARVTADCPLLDPALIDRAHALFLASEEVDYISNTVRRTFPRGMDVELFTMEALEQAWNESSSLEEREHPTLFFHRHPETFRMENFTTEPDCSSYRLTVDTPEDFELIAKILETLYPAKPQFTLQDILALLEKHSDWLAINAHVKQKSV